MTPRIQPLAPAECSEAHRRVLATTLPRVADLEGKPGDARRQRDAKPLPILGVIAHHPALLEPFVAFSTALALRGVLARRDSELLALRTAWSCGSEFEWGHHVRYALSAGLSREEIARVPAGPEAAGWSQRERALLRAADELREESRISDATWETLAAQLDAAQLVEVVFTVGQYTALSMLANSAGVELEAGYERLPPRAD